MLVDVVKVFKFTSKLNASEFYCVAAEDLKTAKEYLISSIKGRYLDNIEADVRTKLINRELSCLDDGVETSIYVDSKKIGSVGHDFYRL